MSGLVEDTPFILPAIDPVSTSIRDDYTSQYYSYSYNRGYDVIYYDASDLVFLLADTSIKALSLSGGTYHDLSPLSLLSELEELYITSNYYITDISPIAALYNLKKLSLDINRVESIAPISELTNLTHLYLAYNGKFYDELAPLQKLEHFSLSIASIGEYNASYIAHLHSLKSLYIGAMSISNIASSDLDISWITYLQMLRELTIRVNRIDDIRPLLELPNLVDVDLHRTVVRDIRPLSDSTSIKQITGFIMENATEDIYSLFRTRGIEFVPFWSDR
jgi:Leucine-rich repeat (LRR) protein